MAKKITVKNHVPTKIGVIVIIIIMVVFAAVIISQENQQTALNSHASTSTVEVMTNPPADAQVTSCPNEKWVIVSANTKNFPNAAKVTATIWKAINSVTGQGCQREFTRVRAYVYPGNPHGHTVSAVYTLAGKGPGTNASHDVATPTTTYAKTYLVDSGILYQKICYIAGQGTFYNNVFKGIVIVRPPNC